MALAAAAHSAQPNATLRGLKTRTRASEEEVHEAYDALRGLKRSPPGVRPVRFLTSLSSGTIHSTGCCIESTTRGGGGLSPSWESCTTSRSGSPLTISRWSLRASIARCLCCILGIRGRLLSLLAWKSGLYSSCPA